MARLTRDAEIVLTDLPEASEIMRHNLGQIQQSNITSTELDWGHDIPKQMQDSSTRIDLVIAADCTYNPDSRWEASPLYSCVN